MARGWESKSVEAQQEAASEAAAAGPQASAAEIRKKQERRALELSRLRVLEQMKSSENPRYREMLEKALAELDSQLQKLAP